MKIGIVSDHRGYEFKLNLKEKLEDEGFELFDFGSNTKERVDFVDYGLVAGEELIKNNVDLVIGICGSGIAASIVLNKVKGVMCSLLFNKDMAIHAKENDGCNAMAFGSEHISVDDAFECVKSFINAKFIGNEYQVRIDKLTNYEESK